MRLLASIFGILGALGALLGGAILRSEATLYEPAALSAGEAAALGAQGLAAYVLLGAGALALVAAVVVALGRGRPLINGLLLLALGALPPAFEALYVGPAPDDQRLFVLGATALVLLAGLFAFGARPARA
jgi:hypothetical protein